MNLTFSTPVCEAINYYVYILIDPRDEKIFYIGKGVNNRIFNHVNDSLTNTLTSDKLNLIREIINENKNVIHLILRHGLTEKEALIVESSCIDLLGLNQLKNKVKGHNSGQFGIMTCQELINLYDAENINIDKEDNCLLINVNKQFHLVKKLLLEGKEAEAENILYEITRSSWLLAKKREKVDYVIATFNGLSREVYKVEKWLPVNKRWEFVGNKASEEIRSKYIHKKTDCIIVKGARNPVKYSF